MNLDLKPNFLLLNTLDIENLRKLDRIHPYPAKFTIDLALEYIDKYTNKNSIILDPFCGSGTTLLASKVYNRKAVGFDVNFIAILISQFKLLDLNKEELNYLKNFNPKFNLVKPYYYKSINHWFKPECIEALSSIREQIKIYSKNNKKYILFLNLIFSSIINISSNQDSDTRYASIEKPFLNTKYIFNKFNEKLYNAINIYKNINIKSTKNFKVFLHNSKKLTQKIEKDSVSLILTSPPYPNTYDYYLYHKHRMCWLDYDFKFSMENEIGSRREYSSLKLPKEKFNNDLLEIFTQSNYILKNGGFIVLIIGDGKIAGKIYNAKEELLPICKSLRWKLIDYSFSELDKTSRSFVQSYRTKNKKEHIMVFQKEC